MYYSGSKLLTIVKLQGPARDPAKTVCLLQDRLEDRRWQVEERAEQVDGVGVLLALRGEV